MSVVKTLVKTASVETMWLARSRIGSAYLDDVGCKVLESEMVHAARANDIREAEQVGVCVNKRSSSQVLH